MLRTAKTLTMLLGTLVLTSGLTLGTAAQAAEVYKYKDDKGNTLYTDKPQTLPAERLNVQSKRSDAPAAAPSANDELKRMQDADAARKQEAAQKSDEKQAAQSTAKDKLERCTKARDKYENYVVARKLYEEQPGGQRRYLSSEELDQARAAAKANMDIWCK